MNLYKSTTAAIAMRGMLTRTCFTTARPSFYQPSLISPFKNGIFRFNQNTAMFSTWNMGFRASPLLNMSASAAQSRPTQYGQNYYNFHGIQYRRAATPGKSVIQNTSKQLMEFTANNLWDNPGARRTKKQLGRGPGSGKG